MPSGDTCSASSRASMTRPSCARCCRQAGAAQACCSTSRSTSSGSGSAVSSAASRRRSTRWAVEDGWHVADDVAPTTLLELYHDEVHRADAVLASVSLDQPPAWWPQDLFGDPHMENVRDVILHVMVETACHAGHLDAARELIDERQWMVLG